MAIFDLRGGQGVNIEVDRILAEDVPAAKVSNPDLMAQIAEFERTWREFQAIKDQAPASPPAVATSAYRTS